MGIKKDNIWKLLSIKPGKVQMLTNVSYYYGWYY